MNRLLYAITFTSDIEEMKRYYRDALGLPVDSETPYWVSFRTGPTRFALMTVHPNLQREIELCFESHDIEDDVDALKARGLAFADTITEQAFGRIIHARDPEGTLVTLLQPNGGSGSDDDETDGPVLHHAIVNCRDIGAAKHFYRERWGLHARSDSDGWVEFEVGGAGLALHMRAGEGGAEQHHAQPVTLTFAVEGLPEWADEARKRGVRFIQAPMDEGWGLMADAVDPDGNVIVLREPPAPASIEEELAEAYEDDDSPHIAAIRKPIQKGSKAVSRVALRPGYKSKKKETSRPAAEPNGRSKKLDVVSPRGTGPAGSRAKPKTKTDPKRARSRPGASMRKKAERRTASRKKRAVARVSKGRPVKRAATKRTKSGRAATRRTTAKRATMKRATAKRAPAKRTTAKRAPAKRAPAKRTVKRSTRATTRGRR